MMNHHKSRCKTFRITTLGCKVNQFESACLVQDLTARGWQPAGAGQAADLHIVNTCAVTSRASMQSRQAVRRAMRSDPRARIIATGCYAQTRPQDLAKIDGLHAVVGHAGKFSLAQTADASWLPENTRSIVSGCENTAARPFAHPTLKRFSQRTRPFLKIQDGCNAFCTYCIVPYARGRSCSMPPAKVLTSLQSYTDAGYREVVLSGIHLGAYGLDLNPPTTLLEMLQRIERETHMARVRLSSVEPHELAPEIIDLLAGSTRFCAHIHIPLQSGDDGILKRMRRPYNRHFFASLVENIHHRMPHAAIGVDVLVGFPGEDSLAFENTRALIEGLPVSYLHVFPFSARPGTAAYHYTDRINAASIKARCAVMRELGARKRMAFYRSMLGRRVEILVEQERDARTGFLKGFTSSYIPVLLEGPDQLKNRCICVAARSLIEQRAVLGHYDPPAEPAHLPV